MLGQILLASALFFTPIAQQNANVYSEEEVITTKTYTCVKGNYTLTINDEDKTFTLVGENEEYKGTYKVNALGEYELYINKDEFLYKVKVDDTTMTFEIFKEITEEEAKKLEKKFRENSFTLDDYLVQFEQINKMGNIADILAMIPGANKLKLNANSIDEKQIAKNKSIILSMTKKERLDPDIIKGSQKRRIASGSGTTIQDVNILLKQFYQSKDMMKMLNGKKKGGFKLPF